MSSARDLLLARAARTIRVEDDSFNINSVTLGSLAPEVFRACQAVLDVCDNESFADSRGTDLVSVHAIEEAILNALEGK